MNALRTRHGTFEFTFTPFGLTRAPGVFQTSINNTFRKYICEFKIVYIVNILIYLKTIEDHKQDIQIILWKVRKIIACAIIPKCFFKKNEVEYLGHFAHQNGIQVSPKRIIVVKNRKLKLSKESSQFLRTLQLLYNVRKKHLYYLISSNKFNKK